MPTRSHKQRKKNKAVLRRAHANLGNLQAEHDPRLAEYYVKTGGFVDRALAQDDPTIVFKGPKGIGKSAILKMVELTHSKDSRRIIRIGPDDLVFTKVANANVDSPLMRSAVDNQWLFKSLWNYVLSVRLLSLEYPLRHSLIEKVMSVFRTEEQKIARQLLSLSLADTGKPQHTLTEAMLRLISEMEFLVEAGGVKSSAVARLKAGDGKAADQLALLTLVERVAKALPSLIAKKYYVLIDDLDNHWSNDPVQNTMIAALFAAMAKLRTLHSVKFVIAIRDDIYRCLPIEDKDKSRDWICDVFWDRLGLKTIVERRMATLHGIAPRQLWDDLLPPIALDLMLQYSLSRPRELIRQLSLAFETACRSGHAEVTQSDLTDALRRNSEEKLEELEQEVAHKFPGIRWVVEHFQGMSREFSLDDLKVVAETITLEYWDNPQQYARYGWIANVERNPLELAYALIDSGVLLIKTSRSALPQEVREPKAIDKLNAPWFAIRPMYCPALLIQGT